MRQRVLSSRPGLDPRADDLASRFRALADPLRLRLAGLLAHGPCPVTALAGATGVGQSLISFHLGELQRAGLVRLERAGRFTYARLNPPGARTLLEQAEALLGLATATPGPTAPAADQDGRAGLDGLVDQLVATILPGLSQQFAGPIGTDRVRQVTVEEATRLASQHHLQHGDAAAGALIAEHAAQRLRALAQTERRLPKPVPEVLFVCTHNAARSQMAAALANQLGHGRVHAWSAGSQPAQAVQPEAVAVMAEIGVDLARHAPKPWTNDLVRAADVVVTMGCGEDIPHFSGVRYVAWQIPNPAGQPLDAVRRIRDQLTAHIRELLADLTISPAPDAQPSADRDGGPHARP